MRLRTAIVLKDFVSEREMARMLRRSAWTLRRWRLEGIGPPHVRTGREILYEIAAVHKWMAAGGMQKRS